jgi:hypothetical protein
MRLEVLPNNSNSNSNSNSKLGEIVNGFVNGITEYIGAFTKKNIDVSPKHYHCDI